MGFWKSLGYGVVEEEEYSFNCLLDRTITSSSSSSSFRDRDKDLVRWPSSMGRSQTRSRWVCSWFLWWCFGHCVIAKGAKVVDVDGANWGPNENMGQMGVRNTRAQEENPPPIWSPRLYHSPHYFKQAPAIDSNRNNWNPQWFKMQNSTTETHAKRNHQSDLLVSTTLINSNKL